VAYLTVIEKGFFIVELITRRPMLPTDEPNDEEKLEELPEDGSTPFTPDTPSGKSSQGDSTRPEDDSGVQPEEWYDGSGTIDEPNKDNDVIGYDPPKK
jgi:hypothetical protein